MSLVDIWSDVEAEQSWRERELRFLHNQLSQMDDVDRDLFRRTIVVMLYAHFEGFCKFVLLAYVRAVNDVGMTCEEANYALAAASLADLFAALRHPSKKCPEFKNVLPDDTKLHRFARDREFIQSAHLFNARPVVIPDHVIDVEDNLKPVVLRKALYRLGLPYDTFANLEGQMHKLLSYRNGIAHGSFRLGIREGEYEEIRAAVFDIMGQVKHEVVGALRDRKFLRAG